jgi:hypothetical protein
MFVLDTNILSAMMSVRLSPQLAAWIAGQPEDALFTSTICQAEILAGLAVMPEGCLIGHASRRGGTFPNDVAFWAAAALLLKRRLKPYSQTISTGACSRSTRRPQWPTRTFSPSAKGRPPDRAARSDDRSRRARQRCRRGHTRYRRFRRLRCPTCRSVAGFILKRPPQDRTRPRENVRGRRARARLRLVYGASTRNTFKEAKALLERTGLSRLFGRFIVYKCVSGCGRPRRSGACAAKAGKSGRARART